MCTDESCLSTAHHCQVILRNVTKVLTLYINIIAMEITTTIVNMIYCTRH